MKIIPTATAENNGNEEGSMEMTHTKRQTLKRKQYENCAKENENKVGGERKGRGNEDDAAYATRHKRITLRAFSPSPRLLSLKQNEKKKKEKKTVQ